MQLVVKNYVFILCYYIFFIKILNLRKKDSIFPVLFFVLPIAILYSYIDHSFPYITYPMLILGFSLIPYCFKQLSFEVSFTASLIAYAFSYLIFAVSAFIIAIIVAILSIPEWKWANPESEQAILIYQCLLAVLEFSFTNWICRFKRLKNGLPFIKNQKYTFSGGCISLCIVVLSTILNNGSANIYYFVLFLFVYIFIVMLITYSQQSSANIYKDALTKRTIDDLNHQLAEKNTDYYELLADKEQLSEIVHRDNKLIPALELAVTTYLKENINETRGITLLEEIKRLSRERNTTIELAEKQLNVLPSCHITAIDNLLSYMQQQAEQYGIQFNVNFHCDLNSVIADIININDLCTLLADIIENAIITTKHNKGKCIMLTFSFIKHIFAIQISDSGTPFTTEVLLSMGLEKITTHGDETGSGIGMMKTFQILKQYHASLIIDEYDNTAGLYSKTVSILYDNKNDFTLYTLRDKDEINKLYERSDLYVVKR